MPDILLYIMYITDIVYKIWLRNICLLLSRNKVKKHNSQKPIFQFFRKILFIRETWQVDKILSFLIRNDKY